jgi:hypothetical protein
MKVNDITKAREEARRFLQRVAEWELSRTSFGETAEGPSKQVAAVRRASLDLTRALAAMRARGR